MKTVLPSKERFSVKKVTFEYFAPQAKKVQLAGDFNGWNAQKTDLKKGKNGKWDATLNLSPGRYQYRFCVDDNWQNDQKPVECIPNPYGTWNCVIEVA